MVIVGIAIILILIVILFGPKSEATKLKNCNDVKEGKIDQMKKEIKELLYKLSESDDDNERMRFEIELKQKDFEYQTRTGRPSYLLNMN